MAEVEASDKPSTGRWGWAVVVVIVIVALAVAGLWTLSRGSGIVTADQSWTGAVELGQVAALDVTLHPSNAALLVDGTAPRSEAAVITMKRSGGNELTGRPTYRPFRHVGYVNVTQSWLFPNKDEAWIVKLNGGVPSTLTLVTGSGAANLFLGDLDLGRLEARLGAGPVTVDLTGKRLKKLDAVIAATSGPLSLSVPGDKPVRITVSGPGRGRIDAIGLVMTSKGAYTTDPSASADASAAISVLIGRGSGPIVLTSRQPQGN